MKDKSQLKLNSEGQKDLEKADQQFQAFDDQVKQLTLDNMNQVPVLEMEPQTRIAQRDMDKQRDIYLKPMKRIGPGHKEKFNEKFRDEYNFQKEYVQFIAENKEIIGEHIELWTKPFGGMDTEFWQVPPNKPVWGPRYLAEKIKKCKYHRLTMDNQIMTEGNGNTQFYGAMAVTNTIQRLDALPVSSRKSIFMGAKSF